MHYDLNESPEVTCARQLVKSTDHPDDLVSIVVETRWPTQARSDAAEKLIKMFRDGPRRCSLQHLAYVGDHADEPYSSEANALIRAPIT